MPERGTRMITTIVKTILGGNRAAQSHPSGTWIAALAWVALACGLPLVSSDYALFQYSQVCSYAIALLGLNILTGYNGQISLGHGAFYAIGGYTTAILIERWAIAYGWTLPVSGVLCFVGGFFFGLPALRLAGTYLALAPLAAALSGPQILQHYDAWTGGTQGMVVPKP